MENELQRTSIPDEQPSEAQEVSLSVEMQRHVQAEHQHGRVVAIVLLGATGMCIGITLLSPPEVRSMIEQFPRLCIGSLLVVVPFYLFMGAGGVLISGIENRQAIVSHVREHLKRSPRT